MAKRRAKKKTNSPLLLALLWLSLGIAIGISLRP